MNLETPRAYFVIWMFAVGVVALPRIYLSRTNPFKTTGMPRLMCHGVSSHSAYSFSISDEQELLSIKIQGSGLPTNRLNLLGRALLSRHISNFLSARWLHARPSESTRRVEQL